MKCIKTLHRTILSAVLFATVAPVVAQDSIPWITDLRQAREVAERQHRLVLLHFWSEDCIPCKQVERNVFNQPEFIRALTTGYVPVKINAAQTPQLAEFYNIERVPTDVIVTPEGREVHRFQSLQDSNQYIAMLDGIRAQASVGQTPIATRPQPETTSASPYGYAPAQSTPSRYGQGGYGQGLSAQPTQPAADSTQLTSQNRYTNPLEQQTAPQQQELAPRYANPYAQQAAENSNTGGSRWGQPTQSYANGTNPTQQPVTPQTNQFAGPGGSIDSRQDAGGSQNRVAQSQGLQSQGSYGQPVPNPAAGGMATQPAYQGGGQTQLSATQPRPSSTEPQFSLEGYCPVTLVQNRLWTPGDKKWGAEHEGRVYLFAGPEQQKQFLANPVLYAPLMAGYDPVRFAETGQLVPGRREFGLYIDEPGPIALFADETALERFHANSGYYFNVIRQAKTQQLGRAAR